MNLDDLLNMLDETLEAGNAVPFAPSKRMVDVDRCRDIIDAVRNNLPDVIHESEKIVNDREDIIRNARTEADGIVKQAEERARNMVNEQEIVKRAEKRAVEILTAAQNQAKELSRSATLYCESILKSSEEVLTKSVADIKNTRLSLRNAAANTARMKKQG